MNNQVQSLVTSSAKISLSLIKESTYFKAYIQFWQTWTNYEICYFLYQNPLIPPDLQTLAFNKVHYELADYNENDFSGSPAYVKNANFFENTNFWDPKNKNIIWDDKLWLGNAYAKLYKFFKIEKFLITAITLYEFVAKNNWEVNNYNGIQWKPSSGYFNTITNGLFFVLCGRLYEATGDMKYMDSAMKQYKYLFCQQGKFVNGIKEGVFPDHIKSEDGGFYSYNQGIPLEGLLYLIAYRQDNGEFIDRAVKLINSTIHYFKSKNCRKLLCVEFSEGDHGFLRTSAIFRSLLFRTFVYMKRMLNPQILNKILAQTPLLKLFILDNAQAMCKFQNLKPCKKWEAFDDGIIHQYNSYNQFYVLLAAHQLYGIQEITVDGICMKGDSGLTVDVGSGVKECSISRVRPDNEKGVYVKEKSRPVREGYYKFQRLIDEDLNNAENNTTYLQLEVIYSDGRQANFIIVHMEAEGSKYGIIADQSAEYIANKYISRIKNFDNQGVTYDSNIGKQISISNPTQNSSCPLRIILH